MKTESPPDATSGAPGTSSPPRTAPASNDPSADESAAKAFRDAMARLAELREYVAFYLATKADALRLSVRSAVFYAILGIVALIAAAAAIVVAVTLLLLGVAHGLGAALHNQFWLGDLIVGIVVLATIALMARAAVSRVFGFSRKQTVEKYESRKRDQRGRFGHDIDGHHERSAR